MQTKILVVIGIVVVLGLAWHAFANGNDVPPPATALPAAVGREAAAPVDASLPLADTEPSSSPVAERQDASTAVTENETVVRGTVVELRGEVLAGATVELLVGPNAQGAALRTVVTDGEGRFEIVVSSAVAAPVLRASAPDHASEQVALAEASRDDVRLQLAPLVDVSGRVLAKPTGAPIVHATVTDGRTKVACDQDGRYTIRAMQLRPKQVWLTATADGFADASQAVMLHEAKRFELDLSLSPTSPMIVQVVDRDTGRPIEGAYLRRAGAAAAPATTDAEGRLTLRVGAGERVVFECGAEGYCPLEWSWTVPADALPSPRLALGRVAWITGRVVDEEGRPLAGVDIRSIRSGVFSARRGIDAPQVPGVLGAAFLRATCTTGEDGEFSRAVTPSNEPQRILATRDGHASARSDELVLAAAGATVRVEVAMERAGTVRGTVLRNGQPMRGGMVRWRRGQDQGMEIADTAGAYVIRNVPCGPVELALQDFLSRDVGQKATVQVVAGEEVRQDFEWEETISAIRGRVTTPDGLPLQDVTVRGSATDRALGRSASAKTDAAGCYLLEIPTAPSFRIYASHAGVFVERKEVLAGATDVDFVLPRSGTLRLLLIDAVTQQPAKVSRRAHRSMAICASGESRYRSVRAEVDATGLVLVEVPIGRVDVQLHFEHSGFRSTCVTGLEVAEADSGPAVRVELTRGVELRMHVTGLAPFHAEVTDGHALFVLAESQIADVRPRGPGDPREGVSTVNGQDLWLSSPMLLNQMPSFRDGGATMAGLTPGRYRLVSFPDDLVFEPATFVVGEQGADVELRWRRR